MKRERGEGGRIKGEERGRSEGRGEGDRDKWAHQRTCTWFQIKIPHNQYYMYMYDHNQYYTCMIPNNISPQK